MRETRGEGGQPKRKSAEKTLEEVSKLVFYAHSRRSSQVIVICHKKPTVCEETNKIKQASNLTKHEILSSAFADTTAAAVRDWRPRRDAGREFTGLLHEDH